MAEMCVGCHYNCGFYCTRSDVANFDEEICPCDKEEETE